MLLSLRDAESWWQSAHATIFPASRGAAGSEWYAMLQDLFGARFTPALDDREACVAAFERHNARVRELVPPARLLEWRATDGWPPLCAALGAPVPAEPFPRVNTRTDFLGARASR